MSSAARYTITFHGSVQGVGFRAATCRVAEGFEVKGWVRNLLDGSVCCVAEGGRGELERFVSAVQESMRGYISDTRIADSNPTGEFAEFSIRF